MTTLAELLNAREVAGARYAAAAAELQAAWIDLAALDATLQNGNVRGLATPPTNPDETMNGAHFGQGPSDIRTFGTAPPSAGALAHPTYFPNDGIDWFGAIKAATANYLASFTAD
ncbi:hypothetical protein [Methylocystis sp. ATCC 49242]|uniref:hypothetical protein n=1 Tax=Methylocystis sp. ATCC 49242 TaxID=622637 RepID=UPI0001F86CD0|nr:hypothetical protein [Methylocystis sp. ATCC 49242]